MRSLPVILVALLLAGCAAGTSSVLARSWLRPVDGPLLREFFVSADRYAAGQHRGVDLGGPAGAAVLAACGGRVSFAGRVPRGGRTISVRCGGLVATYQHLGAVAVRRGQRLLPGVQIGTVGRAQPSPHVHLGARDSATGAYVDPLTLFAGRAPIDLPPLPVARPRPRPQPLKPVPPRAPARPLAVPATRPVAAPHTAGRDRLPWPVWLGVGLVALGIPLGGGFVACSRGARGRRAGARGEAHHPVG